MPFFKLFLTTSNTQTTASLVDALSQAVSSNDTTINFNSPILSVNGSVSDFDKLQDLLTLLIQYPSVVEEAATKRIPHKLSQFALSLAAAFHSYYNDEAIITEDSKLTNEKLTVLNAVSIVLKDSLNLVGVNTKEKM